MMIEGIVVNQRVYNQLKKQIPEKKSTTESSVPSDFRPFTNDWGAISIYVKKYQRNGKIFYNRQQLLDYLKDE